MAATRVGRAAAAFPSKVIPMVGKTISSYEILEKLGEGGMGVVYRARHTTLNRFAALKFLPSHASSDPVVKERFIREARAASALDHPNICTVHDIGETEAGSLYIVMACYEGTTLKYRIEQERFTLDKCLDLASQIAAGLERAHEAGIIHRDLKPANIMVTDRDRAVILDFGVAKLVGAKDLTRSDSTLGTAAYMSPEQIRGEDLDERTDLWSLGVLLYEMLGRTRPFTGGYAASVAYAIVNADPEPISSDIPEDLKRLIDKALAKLPADRFQTAAEMRQALETVRQRIAPQAASVRSSAPLPFRRRLALYAAAGVVLAVLIILALKVRTESVPAQISSIAVLPLENFSGRSDQAYFVDGMTEALTTELSKISGLRVISRTSTLAYRDADINSREIARELDVGALIEGSVLMVGDRVRITAQLIDARTDEHLWADQFDRDLANILQLHSDVAAEITDQIHLTLSGSERARLEGRTRVDPEVYELYLRGRHSWGEPAEETLRASIEYFSRAIGLDSTYAPAYAGAGMSHAMLSHFDAPHSVWPQAKRFAEKALDLDENHAEAYTVLGRYELIYARNWTAAERALTRSIELDPNSSQARIHYAMFLEAMGRFDECVRELEVAKQIDPLSLEVRMFWEVLHFLMGRYDAVIEHAQTTLEIEPEFGFSRILMGTAHAMRGDSSLVVRTLEPVMLQTEHLRDNPISPVWLAFGTYGYAVAGAEAEARRLLAQLVEITRERYVCAYDVGAVFVALGEHDEAFMWLDQALVDASECLPHANVDPRLDDLRGDRRFDDFLTRVGF